MNAWYLFELQRFARKWEAKRYQKRVRAPKRWGVSWR